MIIYLNPKISIKFANVTVKANLVGSPAKTPIKDPNEIISIKIPLLIFNYHNHTTRKTN